MSFETTIVALLLGMLEGLTEFIPVSSTGHLLLASYFLGFDSVGNTFEVVIQLGAVLAILTVYGARLWQVARDAPRDPAAFRFVVAVLIAFLPAVVLGLLAHDFIKSVLFETPVLIAVMLIVGGIILILVDHMTLTPRHTDAMGLPLGVAFRIGLFQTLAMVPGVSRSTRISSFPSGSTTAKCRVSSNGTSSMWTSSRSGTPAFANSFPPSARASSPSRWRHPAAGASKKIRHKCRIRLSISTLPVRLDPERTP